MKNKLYLLIIILTAFNVSFANFATPINPSVEESDRFVGILLGFGQNIQNGIATVNCVSCKFEKGIGFGYTFGFSLEKQLNSDPDSLLYLFNIGTLIQINNLNFSSTYREISSETFSDLTFSLNNTVPLIYRQTNEVSLTSVGLMPYIIYNPLQYFFLKLGINGSYIFKSNSYHKMELLTKKVTLPNGEISDAYFYDPKYPNKKLYYFELQDEPLKSINNLQLSVVPSIGFNIFLSDKFLFSPSFSYGFSVTNISTKPEIFSINGYRFNLEFKYNIAKSYKIYYGKTKTLPPNQIKLNR